MSELDTAIINGLSLFAETTGTDNERLHAALKLCAGIAYLQGRQDAAKAIETKHRALSAYTFGPDAAPWFATIARGEET